MRRVVRGLAIVALVLAALLAMLTLAAWPPGGLMFALPHFFLFPALLLAAVGGIPLLLTRAPRGPSAPDDGDA
jgi:hypothetical protein